MNIVYKGFSLFTYLLTGALYGSLVEDDMDGLFADIIRQLLSTVLRLEDEDTPRDVELKDLKGMSH